MGRGEEASQPPSYSSSEVRYGDTVISKTFLDPSTGSVVTQYLSDPAEQFRKQETEQKLNQVISSLGTTAPELNTQFNQTKEAFINSATQSFDETFEPALKSLKEDIASRFGTLNSSEFLSGLDNLERNRAKALTDIAYKAESVKSDLVNQNEAMKLSQIESLGGVLSSDQEAAISAAKTSLSASDALNDFLNSQWMQSLKSYTSEENSKRRLLSSMYNSSLSNLTKLITN